MFLKHLPGQMPDDPAARKLRYGPCPQVALSLRADKCLKSVLLQRCLRDCGNSRRKKHRHPGKKATGEPGKHSFKWLFIYWRISDLKYYVFKCIIKCFGYIYSFSDPFAYILLNIKYKILTIAHYANLVGPVGPTSRTSLIIYFIYSSLWRSTSWNQDCRKKYQ